jgi:hypothetical protein
LIDLNRDRTSKDRFLELKRPISRDDAIGFLPNGDLIQVSLSDRKIYKYCLTDKPKDTVPWKYSQINDVEISESLYGQYGQVTKLSCSICRTKLFLIVKNKPTLILQFNLSTMNLERQYTLDTTNTPVIISKNQTLLAVENCIFSMENGMVILEYCGYYFYNTYCIFLIW